MEDEVPETSEGQSLVGIPQGAMHLWSVGITSYIDSDGKERYTHAMIGDTNITDLVGTLEAVKFNFLLSAAMHEE